VSAKKGWLTQLDSIPFERPEESQFNHISQLY